MSVDLQAEVDRKEALLQKWQLGYQRLRATYEKHHYVISGLRAEIDSLRGELAHTKKLARVAARASGDTVLLAEIDALRAGLAWYADLANYEHVAAANGTPVLLDRGKRARSALDPTRPLDRLENYSGLQRKVEHQKGEIKRLREERDAMKLRAEAAEADMRQEAKL